MPPPVLPPPPRMNPELEDVDKELEGLLNEYRTKYAPSPGGITTSKSTPSAITQTPTGPESMYGLAGAKAAKAPGPRWETLQKAAAVSKRKPRSPEELGGEAEELRQQYLKAYKNYSSREQLGGNRNYIQAMKSVDWDKLDTMPLEELLEETSQTSQGGGLPGLRDKVQKANIQKKIGDVDINLEESLLSYAERLLLKETSNAKIKVGDKLMSEKEAQLRGMTGVEEVAWEPTLDTFVIKRVVDGKVKYGLADEKGFALGDTAEMLGTTADVILSMLAVGSIPETGPAGPAAVQGGRKWALGRLRDHIAQTGLRRATAEGVLTGGRQYGSETAAQEFLPEDIEGEKVEPASQWELAKRAAGTGAMAAGGQGAFELASKGLTKVAKETLDPTGIRKGIVGPAREARKVLAEKYGIELEGMTAAELLPALARAEKTISEMPFGAKIKEAHQKLFSQVSEAIAASTRGAKTPVEMDDILREASETIPKAEKDLADATREQLKAEEMLRKAEDDQYGYYLGVPTGKVPKAQEGLRRGALEDLQTAAAVQQQKLMAGMELQGQEAAFQKLIGRGDVSKIYGGSTPQVAYSEMAVLADRFRKGFRQKSEALYKNVYKLPNANKPIFNISSMTKEMDQLKRGIRDEEGKVISGLTDQDMKVVDRIMDAKATQTLSDLVAFKQMVYSSMGNDHMFRGLDDKLKRDMGAAVTKLIYDQAPKGGKKFAKSLRKANKHYSGNIDKYYNYGVGRLFLDSTKKQSAVIGELIDDVALSGPNSQMYQDLVTLFGEKSAAMRHTDQIVRDQLIKRAMPKGKVDLPLLLDTVRKLKMIDEDLVKNLGFDAGAMKQAEDVIKTFGAGAGKIDLDDFYALVDKGLVGGGDIASDVSSMMKISRAKADFVADAVNDALGVSSPKIREALATGEITEATAAKTVRDLQGKALSAREQVAARQKALDEVSDNAYLQALRGDGDLANANANSLYNSVFGHSSTGPNIAPAKLQRIMDNLNAAAKGEGAPADAARQLISDIRLRARLDHYQSMSPKRATREGGLSQVETMLGGGEGIIPNPIAMLSIKQNKEYRQRLQAILGEEFEKDDLLAEALATVAARDVVASGVGSMTGKTTWASLAQSTDPAATGEKLTRTFLLSQVLAGRLPEVVASVAGYAGYKTGKALGAGGGTAKAVEWLARGVSNKELQQVARKAFTTMPPLAVEKLKRDLFDSYGEGDAKEIWSFLNMAAEPYEEGVDEPIEKEEPED